MIPFLLIFKVTPKLGQRPWTIVHPFSKNVSEITTRFLLHFQIHIDVLMLCRKFELIPT